MELLETVKKIYDEHLPASYIQRSEEEKDALKKLNALNRKLNPDSAEKPYPFSGIWLFPI